MAKAIIKRVLLLIGTLLLVTLLAFFAFSVIPGDPTEAVLGMDATDAQIAAFRERMGLDLPLWQRYLKWLGEFVTGDFGDSFNFHMPVAQLLLPKVGATLTLAALAFVLIVVLSTPLGLLCARFAGIMYLFALVLRWFRPEYVPLSAGLLPHLWYMLFPALAVAIPKSAMTVRLLRGSVLGELGQDYVRTAYSKGRSRSSVLWGHVLRNAMIPVVTFLAMTIAEILTGSIVVEQVFGVAGVGRILVTSIGNRDYPVVQAIVALVAIVVVCCNFLADILYRVMDPRIDGR